ncbi:MAG: cell division topological specificity factor MinE [Epsilonproteobacteria bacterium]|nr:MAG: cell division topological specificity factor MinE [Campylobacterota bacterium]
MFGWFNKNKSASVAKDRLTIAILSDREATEDLHFMDDLKAEIIEVVKKYVGVKTVNIKKEVENDIEALSIDIQFDRD